MRIEVPIVVPTQISFYILCGAVKNSVGGGETVQRKKQQVLRLGRALFSAFSLRMTTPKVGAKRSATRSPATASRT
jgi:hypothetical protein